MKICFKLACFLFGSYYAVSGHTNAPSQTLVSPAIDFFTAQPAHPKNIWSITGVLKNEADEPMGFSFNLYQQNHTYQVVAAIIDINQKNIVWQKQEQIAMDDKSQSIEQVGAFFWHFSPINASLIVGYEDKQSQAFNLKIDLLEPTTITQTSSLTKNLKFKQYWSGRVNGHFNLNGTEQFVSSDNFWLQQLWQNQNDAQQHAFEELLCKFQDGGALFAIQLHEQQTIHAALAGKFDALGQKQAISQFINIKPPSENSFDIVLEKNKYALHLNQLFNQPDIQVFSGQIQPGDNPGFCIYQLNPWRSMQDIKPIIKPKDSFLAKTIAFRKNPLKSPSI